MNPKIDLVYWGKSGTPDFDVIHGEAYLGDSNAPFIYNSSLNNTAFANIAWYPSAMSVSIWLCKIPKFLKHCATTTSLDTCTFFSLTTMLHFWKQRLPALYSQVQLPIMWKLSFLRGITCWNTGESSRTVLRYSR